MSEQTMIFNSSDIQSKLKRLAYQILEDHYNETEIHLIGIMPGGNILSEILKENIQAIKPISIIEHTIKLNKKKPLGSQIELSCEKSNLKNKSVILVDDVVNTGKTTFYCMQPLTDVELKSLKVAVLVDRLHKKFPIHCDYVGNSLSTTMQEHIDVKFSERKIEGIYLS